MCEYDQRVRGKRAEAAVGEANQLVGRRRRPDHPAHANRVAFDRVFNRIGVAGRVAFVARWHRSADSILQDVHGVPRRYDP